MVPFYGIDENSSGSISEGLFTPQFTALMESNLDLVEDGNTIGAIVWHQFATDFKNMHEKALKIRKQKPTVKQLNLIKNRTSRMSVDDISALFSGKPIEDLTGEDARRIMDELISSNDGDIPPSEKQMNYILKAIDKFYTNIDDFLREKGIEDLDSLTGGKNGTASEII